MLLCSPLRELNHLKHINLEQAKAMEALRREHEAQIKQVRGNCSVE